MENDNRRGELIRAMFRAEHMRRTLIDSVVRRIGLPRTKHMALMHISCKEKLFSQNELAEHLSVTPAAVTGILKSLESDGYIRRAVAEDNRFREIVITDKGRDVVERTKREFDRVDRMIFDGFTDGELDGAIALYERIANNITKAKENLL